MQEPYISLTEDEEHRRLYEETYCKYRKPMLRIARSMLGNDSYSEDIVHDVFVTISEKNMLQSGRIRNDVDLKSYLLQSTKNAALDHIRKRRHESILFNAGCDSDLMNDAGILEDVSIDKILCGIEYDRIMNAIASLKDIYREALYLHFVMNLSVPEISKQLNCKASTIKQRLVRGKKLLRKKLLTGNRAKER